MPVAPPPGQDTHPAVEAMMTAYWRRATPTEKLTRLAGMGRTLNELARAELRLRFPDATPREIDLRFRSRTLDRETMIRAFGWDPDLQGR